MSERRAQQAHERQTTPIEQDERVELGTQSTIARALFNAGDYERAIDAYQRIHQALPRAIAPRLNLALALLKAERFLDARILLEHIVSENPNHRRGWGYLGVALEQLGMLGAAESAYLSGHFPSAAQRVHNRRVTEPSDASELSDQPDRASELALDALPYIYRRIESPGDPGRWGPMPYAIPGGPELPRFAATLRPPDFEPDPSLSSREVTTVQPAHAQGLLEDPMLIDPMPIAPDSTPRHAEPVRPLLDAALSSLLVIPPESAVSVHPTGLVLVGLQKGEADSCSTEGFVARSDVIHALGGALRAEPVPERPRKGPAPFQSSPQPFCWYHGRGQLVLAPPAEGRLMPLSMDADVAFFREDLIVAFDHRLLFDLGRIHAPNGESISVVRFRGDGVIVLNLPRPFLAFDVRGSDGLTLRRAALIGWLGTLIPETDSETSDPHGDIQGVRGECMRFSGDGTVLFSATPGTY
ncbi:MAG: tetratricopeptide repeat protein [Polyangiaceae bacterium]